MEINNVVWTALVSPLDARGAIHRGSMERLLRRQEAAGNGILLFGSTGEGLAFSEAEKQATLEWVCELNLTVPLMVAVAGHQLANVLDFLYFCEELPLHAYLLTLPYYARPGCEGQERWFLQILDAVERPCMLYNHPVRCGCGLHIKAARAASEHERLWAIKDASGDLAVLEQFREELPQIMLYSGNDDKAQAYCAAGACGLVSVMANAWPEATWAYLQQCLEADPGAQHQLWQEAAAALSRCNPTSIKQLLYHKQLISTPYTRPPLHPDDAKSPGVLLKLDARIQEWYKIRSCVQSTTVL